MNQLKMLLAELELMSLAHSDLLSAYAKNWAMQLRAAIRELEEQHVQQGGG